jgi:penicillin-insensitive murein DD-endopeptidase
VGCPVQQMRECFFLTPLTVEHKTRYHCQRVRRTCVELSADMGGVVRNENTNALRRWRFGWPRLGGLIGSCMLMVACPGYADNPWGGVREPTDSLAQAIGAYDLGCLGGARMLPAKGDGYRAIRLFRRRYFGHPRLIEFVQTLGHQAVHDRWGTLLVGDLSQPRGGPPVSGHRSHQTGLDVDIWFQSLEDYLRSGTGPERLDSRDPASVVFGDKLHPSLWKTSYGQVLAAVAQVAEVDRIFVNPVIKRALCADTSGARAWLAKLRPWWGHDDHFHVRLKCPAGERDCVGQPSPPPGDGCDDSLDWWFSAAAKAPQPLPTATPRPLPVKCETVLRE